MLVHRKSGEYTALRIQQRMSKTHEKMMARSQTIALPHVRRTDDVPMHDVEDPTRVTFGHTSPSRFFGRGSPLFPRW